MPISDHDFEWLKILVSTLAGLFAGLIAEPFKSTVQRKIEIVRLERAIGLDCLRIRMAILSTTHGLVHNPSNYWKLDPLPAYDHYWASKRELFYVDFDLQQIHMVCMHIQLIRQKVLEGRQDGESGMTDTDALVTQILNIRSEENGSPTIPASPSTQIYNVGS